MGRDALDPELTGPFAHDPGRQGAAVAAACGFANQPDMIRELRALAGRVPRTPAGGRARIQARIAPHAEDPLTAVR
jgi:hypothetical protein